MSSSFTAVLVLAALVTPIVAYENFFLMAGLLEFNTTQMYRPGLLGATVANNLNFGIKQRKGAGAVSLGNGKALFCGGTAGPGVYADCAIFDASFNQSTPTTSMLQARHSFGMNIDKTGKVTVCGGQTDIGRVGTCEQYDGSSWTPIAKLPIACSELALANTPAGLIAFGGVTEEQIAIRNVWAYDPNPSHDNPLGTWKHRSYMPEGLRGFGAVEFPGAGDIIMVCGGFTSGTENNSQKQCYSYDPSGIGTWTTCGQMSYTRGYFSLVPWTMNGKLSVWALGGSDGNGNGLSIVEEFTGPCTNGVPQQTDLKSRIELAATVGIV